MCDLIVNDKLISTDIVTILETLRRETGYKYFDRILSRGENLSVQCPFHKEGNERKNSCSVYVGDDPNMEPGVFHCFTCGKTASLAEVVAYCLGEPDNKELGKDWLVERFGQLIVKQREILEDIVIPQRKPVKINYLDESILDNYRYYHDYMWQRKMSKVVVDTFDIGFDPQTQCLTFPIRDSKGGLIGVSRRSVLTKFFEIPESIEKPFYLLYYAKKMNFKTLMLVEGQIDALTCYSYGMPAVATMGSISTNQMEELNKCGVRNFISCFDNDDAGRRFTERFKKLVRKDVFITEVELPRDKKDVNDLTLDEFNNMLLQQGITQRLTPDLTALQEIAWPT